MMCQPPPIRMATFHALLNLPMQAKAELSAVDVFPTVFSGRKQCDFPTLSPNVKITMPRFPVVQSALLTAAIVGALSAVPVQPVLALGPKDYAIGLVVKSYAEVECPPELAQGRAGGALGAGASAGGIAQKCVEVTADVTNDSGKEVQDAAVFGVITEKATGMSVLGNGQGRMTLGSSQ